MTAAAGAAVGGEQLAVLAPEEARAEGSLALEDQARRLERGEPGEVVDLAIAQAALADRAVADHAGPGGGAGMGAAGPVHDEAREPVSLFVEARRDVG